MNKDTLKKEEKDWIAEYFCNPKNVSDKIYVPYRSGEIEANEFFEMVEPEQENSFVLMKKIVCKDGFTMSVQASHSHYCTPRTTIYSKHICFYSKFEVGYPSIKVRALKPYEAGGSVYGYVPKELLNQIITKHGGIKYDN